MIEEYMYEHIRSQMRVSVISYTCLGYLPGDFLQAVLRNELVESTGRADQTNITVLHVWAGLLVSSLPSRCWGSQEAIEKWVAERRENPLNPTAVEWPSCWRSEVAEIEREYERVTK